MERKEIQKQQDIREACYIFVDAINYDAETLIAYFYLAKAIYGNGNMEEVTLLLSRLVDMLSTVTPREGDVLKYRFGLTGSTPMTYKEIGEIYGLSQERIRQITSKALRKMRHPSRTAKVIHLRDRKISELKLTINSKNSNSLSINEKKRITIEELELSVRSYHCLKKAGVDTLGQLIMKSEEDIRNLRNMGQRSTNEIIAKVKEYGFDLKKA